MNKVPPPPPDSATINVLGMESDYKDVDISIQLEQDLYGVSHPRQMTTMHL